MKRPRIVKESPYQEENKVSNIETAIGKARARTRKLEADLHKREARITELEAENARLRGLCLMTRGLLQEKHHHRYGVEHCGELDGIHAPSDECQLLMLVRAALQEGSDGHETQCDRHRN